MSLIPSQENLTQITSRWQYQVIQAALIELRDMRVSEGKVTVLLLPTIAGYLKHVGW
jgi:hypothetical protein